MTTLKVYRTNITPERNALVDNIDAYLATCSLGYTSDSYQTQKIEIDKEFVLNVPQDLYEPRSLGNYLVINQVGKNYYYFIIGYEWTAVNSCALQCVMDTVNTYKNELVFNNKTRIHRELRDRFKEISDYQSEPIQEQILGPSGSIYSKEYTIQNDKLKNVKINSVKAELTPGLGDATIKVNGYEYDSTTGVIDITSIVNVVSAVGNKCTFSIIFTVDIVSTVVRKIDRIPEGINPVLYGSKITDIYEEGDTDSWYVVYNTEFAGEPGPDATGAIKTYLCKDTGFNASISSSSTSATTLTPAQLEQGVYYIVDPKNVEGNFRKVEAADQNQHALFTTGTHRPEISQGSYPTYSWEDGIGFYRSGESIYVERISFQVSAYGSDNNVIEYQTIGTVSKIRLTSDENFVIYKYSGKPAAGHTNKIRQKIRQSDTLPVSEAAEEVYINGLNDMDKTQPTLVKIVKFPYCPIGYRVINNVYHFDVLVGKHVDSKLKTTFIDIPSNVEFGHKLNITTVNPFHAVQSVLNINAQPTDLKDMKYETKLLNSEFNDPRLVYDSFIKSFDLEKLNTDAPQSLSFNIDYTPSRVFNSAFMFTFPEYRTADLDDENYNNILICNRNNEMPIFSSSYLEYVRNGYNYDVKAKNLSILQSFGQLGVQAGLAGIGLSAVNATAPSRLEYLANAGSPSKQDLKIANEMFGAQGPRYAQLAQQSSAEWKYLLAQNRFKQGFRPRAISAGITAVGATLNTVSNIVQAEQSLKQKLQAAQASSISVSSADAVDLLEKYSDNKAKLMNYHPSVEAKKALFDLFYYTGYKTDLQKKPNFNTRYWFDFIQADPVFEPNGIYQEFIDDIKDRFQAGITIYHSHNGQYDWDQEHENWENWLIR